MNEDLGRGRTDGNPFGCRGGVWVGGDLSFVGVRGAGDGGGFGADCRGRGGKGDGCDRA